MDDRRSGDADDEFERAMADVEPIEPSRRKPVKKRRAPRRGDGRGAPEFELVRQAQRVEGRRREVDEEVLARLKRGEIRPQNRLDLHGMSEEAARQEVYRFVRQSRASGLECIALVHGRGLRSPAGPVLKQRLPVWLTQLPLARDVRAFGAAPQELGGDGVTLVLLVRS